eukprot:263308-Amphidinium_carterae.2
MSLCLKSSVASRKQRVFESRRWESPIRDCYERAGVTCSSKPYFINLINASQLAAAAAAAAESWRRTTTGKPECPCKRVFLALLRIPSELRKLRIRAAAMAV